MSMRQTFLRRLSDDRSGVALIELALSLPVLLTLGLMGIETARYAIASMRCSQMAMTVADNASRVRVQITEDDIAELMQGAKTIGQGINFSANGRIILSDLEPYEASTPPDLTKSPNQWIRWQRCSGDKEVTSTYGVPKSANGSIINNGTERTTPSDPAHSQPTNGTATTATGMGPANNQIAAARGTAVMFVEVIYDYQPLVPLLKPLLGTRTINFTAAFNVRQRTDQVLYAGTTSVLRCSVFAP